ncbi:MAG: hypothetical protein MMC33_010299 [Icmadophila ericetorum]|nr:hypothetical protein [Icmadophila ericetorum]
MDCPYHAIAFGALKRTVDSGSTAENPVTFSSRRKDVQGLDSASTNLVEPFKRPGVYREERSNHDPTANSLAPEAVPKFKRLQTAVPTGMEHPTGGQIWETPKRDRGYTEGNNKKSAANQGKKITPGVTTVHRGQTLDMSPSQEPIHSSSPTLNEGAQYKYTQHSGPAKDRTTKSPQYRGHRWLMLRASYDQSGHGKQGILSVPVDVEHGLHSRLQRFYVPVEVEEHDNIRQATKSMHELQELVLVLDPRGTRLVANSLYHPTPPSSSGSSLSRTSDINLSNREVVHPAHRDTQIHSTESHMKKAKSEPVLSRKQAMALELTTRWIDDEGMLTAHQKPKRSLRRDRRPRSVSDIHKDIWNASRKILPLFPNEDPVPETQKYRSGSHSAPAISITSPDPHMRYDWRPPTTSKLAGKSSGDDAPPTSPQSVRATKSLDAILHNDVVNRSPIEPKPESQPFQPPKRSSFRKWISEKVLRRRATTGSEEKSRKLQKEKKAQENAAFWKGIDLDEEVEP